MEDWDTFYAEAEKLYVAHPAHVRAAARPRTRRPGRLPTAAAVPRAQTRYVVKYRHCDGKLVLKVTNDRVVRQPLCSRATTRLRLSSPRRAPIAPPSGGAGPLTSPCAPQCLKFETDQAQDVKRLEKLNNLFFTYMCGKDPHEDADGAPDRSRARPTRFRARSRRGEPRRRMAVLIPAAASASR